MLLFHFPRALRFEPSAPFFLLPPGFFFPAVIAAFLPGSLAAGSFFLHFGGFALAPFRFFAGFLRTGLPRALVARYSIRAHAAGAKDKTKKSKR